MHLWFGFSTMYLLNVYILGIHCDFTGCTPAHLRDKLFSVTIAPRIWLFLNSAWKVPSLCLSGHSLVCNANFQTRSLRINHHLHGPVQISFLRFQCNVPHRNVFIDKTDKPTSFDPGKHGWWPEIKCAQISTMCFLRRRLRLGSASWRITDQTCSTTCVRCCAFSTPSETTRSGSHSHIRSILCC